jgi:Neutral/alkaline non-lysosomal ceramidase, N-terminal
VAGPVDFIHQWVDMTKYPVQLANGSMASTCKAALGYSFAAGTTDGPGEFDFTQVPIKDNVCGKAATMRDQSIDEKRRNTYQWIEEAVFTYSVLYFQRILS